MYIKNVDFNKAQDLMNFIAPWNTSLNDYIFRGHSDENYELLPISLREHEFDKICSLSPNMSALVKSGERESAKDLMLHELHIIREFYKLSDSNGLNVPVSPEIRRELSQKRGDNIYAFTNNFTHFEWLPEKLWELAALTQHYGLPTRLLDWTYDAFVAAYFASCSKKNTSKGRLCIWGLNKDQIEMAKLIGDEIIPLHYITPHYAGNKNITAQKGLFTLVTEKIIYTSIDKPDRIPLDEKIKPYIDERIYNGRNEPIFIKITLPKSEAPSLFNLLTLSGYGTSRLFPGYDGVAKQLLENNKPASVCILCGK